MSPLPPKRRRARFVAVATLVLLHLAAIEALLTHHRMAGRARVETFTQWLALRPTETPPVSDHALPLPRREPLPITVPAVPAVPDDVQPAPASTAPTPATIIGTAASGSSASSTAAAGAGPGRLNLAIPKDFYEHPPPLTPGQEAMLDPRSNRLVLTKQEQMDVDFGVVECIAWQRMPDGSIYRGPGHMKVIPGLQVNPFGKKRERLQECVK